MKTTLASLLAAGVSALGLAALAGCSNVPLAQSTSESMLASTYTAATAPAGLEPPVPIHTVQPLYPFDMRRAGITGLVQIAATVDENGRVTKAEIEDSTSREFEAPALEAVRQWKFEPARRDGQAIAVRVKLPVNFSLRED